MMAPTTTITMPNAIRPMPELLFMASSLGHPPTGARTVGGGPVEDRAWV
jgi:hypothetical protein